MYSIKAYWVFLLALCLYAALISQTQMKLPKEDKKNEDKKNINDLGDSYYLKGRR